MLIVKSYIDLIKNNEVIWKEKNAIRLSHLGVIYFKNNKWPKAFKCEESWDAHFCDSWYEIINKDEIISYLKKEIENNKKILEENTKLLESINEKN